MNDFTRDLIKRLRSLPCDPVVTAEELLEAEEVLLRFKQPTIESHIEEINEEAIEPEEAKAIRDELLRLLEITGEQSPARPTIIWALSKLSDNNLEPLFWRHLEKSLRYYRFAAHYLGQCFCALERVGIEFPAANPDSSPVYNMAKIINQAELALLQRNVLVPH